MRRTSTYILTGLLLLTFFWPGHQSQGQSQNWQPDEHPRLLATAGERNAIVEKLTRPNTTSNALWQYFVNNNLANYTSAGSLTYADAGVLYWVTGTASYGQKAHDAVMNYVNSATNLINPTLANYDLGFWQYRDMLLNYDFAYDRFSVAERQTVLRRVAQQGTKCHAAGAAWAAGNIHALWGLCEYISAVMLENENVSLTITDEPVTRQSGTTKDTLKYPLNLYNISIRSTPGGPVTYTATTDYLTCESVTEGHRCIDWAPTGAEPASGSTYYVTYTLTPQVELWRIGARLFIEAEQNYHWRDGTYTGGFHPYSGAAFESIIDFIEIARRDMGIDYSQNVDFKKFVDVALYERLPYGVSSYLGYRYDTLSDSGTWGEDPINHPSSVGGYRGWVRRMTAYGMSRFGNDPEYAAKYLWFWGQNYRNTNGTIKPYPSAGGDWREALYFNDSLTSSYPVTTLPAPTWATYRFFRGRDLAIARTDRFGITNLDAAYVSFFAQNHNHQSEHDQGDSGSFTFFSNREDWAIDPGYQQYGTGGRSQDHNTVGIDGAGYYATGVYGMANTSPEYGGFSYIEHVAMTDGASAMKANLTHAWSLTETPFVDHQYRYLAMVNGGPSSYLVVGDDIKKDNANHTFPWWMSTGIDNTVTRSGMTATITGARNSATLDVVTVNPPMASVTASDQDWQAGNISYTPYKRLTISANSTVNPYLLNLLIPTPVGSAKPSVTRSAVTNGVRASVTWPNGMIDDIYWRTQAGTVSDGTVSTDGALTVLRRTAGNLTGLLIMDGRTVTRNGAAVFTAVDGVQPVTFSSFDGTAAVSGLDASYIKVALTIHRAHIADGRTTIPVVMSDGVAYLTAGQAFDHAERSSGLLFNEPFNSTYVHNLTNPNLNRFPISSTAVSNGILDLREAAYDWPSISRRDSTPWRRSNLTPSAIPGDMFGDGDYSFAYRFTDATSPNRKFRTYLRVSDHNATDWFTNQNYVRLDIDPIAGQMSLGQRVDGAWTDIANNDVLTASTTTQPISVNDTNWHRVRLRLENGTYQLDLDGVRLAAGTINGPMPGPGYWQWRIVGAAHVQLDDLVVAAIDHGVPPTPTSGSIQVSGTDGVALFTYGQGQAPDITTVDFYRSPDPILPTDDPAGLTLVRQTTDPQDLGLTNVDRSLYYAASLSDAAGNRTQLVPLSIDTTPPASIGNLQAN